jgi:hypothetical protein
MRGNQLAVALELVLGQHPWGPTIAPVYRPGSSVRLEGPVYGGFRILIPFARYPWISASLTSSFMRAAGVPFGRPKGRPAAVRLARASVVRNEIISRSISATRPNTVAVIRFGIDPPSTICCLAMCTLPPLRHAVLQHRQGLQGGACHAADLGEEDHVPGVSRLGEQAPAFPGEIPGGGET